MLGEVAHETGAVDLAEQRRRFAQRHRAGAEGLENQPEAREFFGTANETLDVRFLELDDFRDEKNLARRRRFFSIAALSFS